MSLAQLGTYIWWVLQRKSAEGGLMTATIALVMVTCAFARCAVATGADVARFINKGGMRGDRILQFSSFTLMRRWLINGVKSTATLFKGYSAVFYRYCPFAFSVIQFEEVLRRFAESFSPNPSSRVNSFFPFAPQSPPILSRPAGSSSVTVNSAINENEDARSDSSNRIGFGSTGLPHSPQPPSIPSIQTLLANLASLRKDLEVSSTPL